MGLLWSVRCVDVLALSRLGALRTLPLICSDSARSPYFSWQSRYMKRKTYLFSHSCAHLLSSVGDGRSSIYWWARFTLVDPGYLVVACRHHSYDMGIAQIFCFLGGRLFTFLVRENVKRSSCNCRWSLVILSWWYCSVRSSSGGSLAAWLWQPCCCLQLAWRGRVWLSDMSMLGALTLNLGSIPSLAGAACAVAPTRSSHMPRDNCNYGIVSN